MEQLAKSTGYSRNDPITVLDQAGQDGFEAGSRGATDRKASLVSSTEHESRQLHDIVHHTRELWIELSDQRSGQRREHTWFRVARSRAEQKPWRQVQVTQELSHWRCLCAQSGALSVRGPAVGPGPALLKGSRRP